MKIQPDKSDTQVVTAHGPGWLAVNGQRMEHSVLVGYDGLLRPWAGDAFAKLSAADFEPLAALDYDVVLFGSGQRLRFVPPAWLAALMRRGIGVETMDTMAAGRTYNVLAGEGRHVLAALLVEPATPG